MAIRRLCTASTGLSSIATAAAEIFDALTIGAAAPNIFNVGVMIRQAAGAVC
jgi:hypothetical protein